MDRGHDNILPLFREKANTLTGTSTPLIQITPLPALGDHANYIYILRDESLNKTWAIDPGDASPVIHFCDSRGWNLDGILITHHHWDHVDGIPDLKDRFHCSVYGSTLDAHRLPHLTHTLPPEGEITLGNTHLKFSPIPGHTLGHIYYYLQNQKALFCGDTLFSCGCGKLFEGTPEMMLAALKKIRAFPNDTWIYCGHEYTERNLEFTLHLEPDNPNLQKRFQEVQALRENNQITLPVQLESEKKLNPFLRWDDVNLKKALKMEKATDLEVFTWLREKRNRF